MILLEGEYMTDYDWALLVEDLVDAWYATWMSARAEVEGAVTADLLFEKEPEIVRARKALSWSE